ncbi:hypothetical protein SCHPADRAFT_566530 [Schizopora paradoxa]|uniref:C2H2-type domain-containing protein n=1 Tax=Schizopora paradoxa TaxID=27342 RepID=A0A0H2RCB8_9AGAM|nr:hypothetical protein SCHPADRAFT_566530 [Schizopora paradoxa]
MSDKENAPAVNEYDWESLGAEMCNMSKEFDKLAQAAGLKNYQGAIPTTASNDGHDLIEGALSVPLADKTTNPQAPFTASSGHALALYLTSGHDANPGTQCDAAGAQNNTIDTALTIDPSYPADPFSFGPGHFEDNVDGFSASVRSQFFSRSGELETQENDHPIAGPSTSSGQVPAGHASHQSVDHWPPPQTFGRGALSHPILFNQGGFVTGIDPTTGRCYRVPLSMLSPVPPSMSIPHFQAAHNRTAVTTIESQNRSPAATLQPQAFNFATAPDTVQNLVVSTHVMQGTPSHGAKGKGKLPARNAVRPLRPMVQIPTRKIAVYNQTAIKHGLPTPCGSQPPSTNPSPTSPFSPTAFPAPGQSSSAPFGNQAQLIHAQSTVEVATSHAPPTPLTPLMDAQLYNPQGTEESSSSKRKAPGAGNADQEKCVCLDPTCLKDFASIKALRKHMRDSHSTALNLICPRGASCTGKGKGPNGSYSREDSLRRHLHSDTGKSSINGSSCYETVKKIAGPPNYETKFKTEKKEEYSWSGVTLLKHFIFIVPVSEDSGDDSDTEPKSKRRKRTE